MPALAAYPPDLRHEIAVVDGDTFFVSDERGDVVDQGPYGLFHQDTRFVSRYRLEVNGRAPSVLTSRAVDYFSAAFFLANPPLDGIPENRLSIVRHRFVGDGAHDDVFLHNHSTASVHVRVTLEIACDFADLFEVKAGGAAGKGERVCEIDEDARTLRYVYRRDGFVRETSLAFTEWPELETGTAVFDIVIPPHGSWHTCIMISLATGGVPRPPKYTCSDFQREKGEAQRSLAAWHWSAPRLDSDWDGLNQTFRRSCSDLAALRLRANGPGTGPSLLAAGLPWFMTLFGRDTLITSFQTLMFGPGLAIGALRELASRQGTRVDDFRDEEPGKILHELRCGELTVFGETPHGPYYGSADATPLFLILLHEVYRWTADRALAEELEENARRALEWIDAYGDLDGDGYVEYETRSRAGLRNQGWKDSGDAVLFPDGSPAEPPIALCEVQGYVYDAKLRMAELAEDVWDDERLAQRLRRDASGLKKRFNRDFWCGDASEAGHYALALDRDKQRVKSLTSNVGHLLWSGIVDDEKVQAVVNALMSEALYSGWGVRTMSTEDRGFNPIGYHIGTVWPHDNSIIAAGLARHGYRAEANRIVADVLDAAASFRHRLPEAFAGYARERYTFAVRYPTSSSPHAWAAGTPILFLRTMLGLEPDRHALRLAVAPVLPDAVTRLSLGNVTAFGKRYDVVVAGDRCEIVESPPP